MDIDQLIINEENLARSVAAGRPTCASCLHWSPFNSVIKKIIHETASGNFAVDGGGSGECLRYPPRVVEGQSEGQYPETSSGQSCGEWAIREHGRAKNQVALGWKVEQLALGAALQ